MASYLQGVTDVPVPIAPFQPDFGMMQKAMTTLQGRYEQGFASVKNVYNQVLNAPLTDPLNRGVRDAFVKDAERKLQHLSSVDLSIPENQSTAEGVFSPFWEDSMILQDTVNTKWYQGEMQKAQAVQNSTDEKVRSQYSDAAVRYLQNGLEKLQGAGRDASKYAKLEKRRFVPFQDMKLYLNEQAEKTGFKVIWESAEGPYLVKRENGVRSTKAFETFAGDMLGDKFQDQFHVMGVVDKEERVRNVKRMNPALTDEQALAEVAKGIDTEYKSGLSSRTELLQKELDKVTTAMKPYLPLKQLDKVQDKAFEGLSMQQVVLEKQLELSKEDESSYKSKEEGILANPDGYFASVMKHRAISAWANARAAGEQVTRGIDPVWKENVDIARYQREMEIKLKELGIKVDEFGLRKLALQEKADKDGVTLDGLDSDLFGDDEGGLGLSSGSSGGGGVSTSNSLNPEKAGRYQSRGATDVTKLANPYQLFQERQVQRWGVAHNELFSDTAAGKVLTDMGVPMADAVKYMSAMKKYSMDLSEKNISEPDKALLHDLTRKLTGKDVTGHAGFFELRTKMLDNMRATLEDKLKEGGTGLNREDADMVSAYVTSTWAIMEHDMLEEERKRLVQEEITRNPKSYGKILTNKNGKNEIAGLDDMVKDFKPITLRDKGTNQLLKLSARDVAELYMNGKFDASDGYNISIDGKSYKISEFNGQSEKNILTWNRPEVHLAEFLYGTKTGVQNKYGTSQEQKKLRDRLNDEVLPNSPEFQSENGKLGFVVRYDLAAKGKKDVGTLLIQEAAQEGNHLGIYVDGVLSKNTSMNDAIMNLMKQGDETMKDYISSALVKTIGPTGRPTLEVVLQPNKTSDKTKSLDRALGDLTQKKTIEFELNPAATGDTLRKLRFNSGMYVFGSLLRGHPMSSDPILKAAGFSFDITPDDPSNPQKAIVQVRSKEFVNGAYRDTEPKRQDYFFDRITPDELVHNLYGFFFQQLKKNMAAQQVYQQQMGQTGGKFRTPAEIMEGVRKGL